MKTFEEFYSELQSINNNELNYIWNEAKRESNKSNKISIIVCLIIDLIVIITLLVNKQLFLIFPILMAIIVLNIFIVVIMKIVFSNSTNNYNKKYKNIVINQLMSNFYDNLEYFPDKEIPEYIYRKNRYEDYDIYNSEDYMEGQINNRYSIQMGEVLTKRIERSKEFDESIGVRTIEGEELFDREKQEITVFHGLFAKIEIDKSIESNLKIMQNGSFWLQKKLKMDSSEFEKYFDVKASNQIIGMQILTADIMEELVEFENKTKMKYDIIIDKNEIYLRFYSGDMFEPTSIKDGPLEKNTIEKYFYMLNFTYNLSNKLIDVINNTEI